MSLIFPCTLAGSDRDKLGQKRKMTRKLRVESREGAVARGWANRPVSLPAHQTGRADFQHRLSDRLHCAVYPVLR
jgi:hypothetical protein